MNRTTLTVFLVVVGGAGLYYILRRTPQDDEQFVDWLLDTTATTIAKVLDKHRQDVEFALRQCRAGQPNELAQTTQLRVECSVIKLSASRVSVTVSVVVLKAGKPEVITIRTAASWDDLPKEIRSEFIRNNPPEVHYVICEQPTNLTKAL